MAHKVARMVSLQHKVVVFIVNLAVYIKQMPWKDQIFCFVTQAHVILMNHLIKNDTHCSCSCSCFLFPAADFSSGY